MTGTAVIGADYYWEVDFERGHGGRSKTSRALVEKVPPMPFVFYVEWGPLHHKIRLPNMWPHSMSSFPSITGCWHCFDLGCFEVVQYYDVN